MSLKWDPKCQQSFLLLADGLIETQPSLGKVLWTYTYLKIVFFFLIILFWQLSISNIVRNFLNQFFFKTFIYLKTIYLLSLYYL